MKNIKFTKIIAFFMAVLMILPMIPAVDLTVFAEGAMAVSTEDLLDDIGRIATINPDVNLFSTYKDPSFGGVCKTAVEVGSPLSNNLEYFPYSLDIEFLIEDVCVADGALFYKVTVIKEGETTPDIFDEYPWINQRYVDESTEALILGEKYDILQDATLVNRTAYFTQCTIRLYNTEFEVYEYEADDNEVYVAYSFVYNDEYYYWLSGEGFDGKEFCIVKEKDIVFLNPAVSPLETLLRYKVRFLPECGIVDYLYSEPGYEATALSGVMVTELPELFIIVDTYYTSEDDIYFRLEADGSDWWMADCGYDWVSADLLELVTINYTDMAPFGPPVIGQSMAVYARSLIRAREVEEVAERLEAEGVETKKTVVPTDTPGEYIVTLEAYVTGQKTTVTITEDIATDIILVLDQSGSMAYNDFKTVSTYTVASGKASNFLNQDVYVKDGEAYIKVTVTTKSDTKYNYTRYQNGYKNENKKNSEIYANQSNLFYKINGEYWPITVTRSSKDDKKSTVYTYYYTPASGNPVQIGSSTDKDTRPDFNTYRFYTGTPTTAISEYIFSYVDTNGTTQSESFGANADITTNKYYTETDSTITRLQALKNAVTAFAESVHKKAKGKDGELGTADDVNHRVAIVGFANYSNHDNYNNTEVFVGGTGYKYGSAAEGVYSKALQDMNTTAGYNNIIASKNALDADGATYVDLGIEMANGILAANPVAAGEKRNRVVIVFTDGDPGYTGKWEGKEYTEKSGNAEAVADVAISNANTTKNSYGATVYTIGVFNGADAETRPVSGLSNGNKFMHYVSNNYKNSTSFDNPGAATFPDRGSYYLSANNTDDLTGIFKQISSNVEGGGADRTLDSKTVVRDIVSPNFVVPNGVSGIKYYTQEYIGKETSGEKKWDTRVEAPNVSATRRESDGTTTLDVTGFDFSENYVGTETMDGQVTGYRGKKLIIEFTIKEDPDFLGGSNVDTNGALSGIYTGEYTPVEYFEQPKVNVALKEISTVVQDKYIYLGNTTDLTGLMDLYVKVETNSETNLKVVVDGVNNAYVRLQYTITYGDKSAVYTIEPGKSWSEGNWSGNTDSALLRQYMVTSNGSFSITCVMTDAGDDSKTSTASDVAKIYVFKPIVTFKDSVQNYNKSLKMGTDSFTDINDFLDEHYVGTAWLCEYTDKEGNKVSRSSSDAGMQGKMEGIAPTLTFEFAPSNSNQAFNTVFEDYKMKSTRDVPVTVTATIRGYHCVMGNDGTMQSTPVAANEYITDLTRKSENIMFAHYDGDDSTCGKKTCAHDSAKDEFIVHVINAITQLTIRKSGWNSNDPNQTFLFRVTGKDGDGNNIDLIVTVHEGGSVTIDGLIIDNQYNVTELTDWSWRYQFERWEFVDGTTSEVNGATITLGETGNVITFTNSRPIDVWLDGDSWCDNRFSNNINQTGG